MLKHPFGSCSLRMVHVTAAFVLRLSLSFDSSIPLQHVIPWYELAEYLNRLLKGRKPLKKREKFFIWSEDFPTPEREERQQLPEDFFGERQRPQY